MLVTMLGDIAQNYVQVRTDQEQIKTLQANVELQRGVLQFIENATEGRLSTNRVGLGPGREQLEADRGRASRRWRSTCGRPRTRLCILLGMPPVDLANMLGTGPIPSTPPEVAIGIPADLLRRRPDVRQAERLAAAQAEQIGIAQADLYPAFSINGSLGYSAQELPRSVQEHRLQRQRRPVVPMEPAELRPDRQQRPLPGREVPGTGGHLSANRAPGRPGSGRRAGDVPAIAATARSCWTKA